MVLWDDNDYNLATRKLGYKTEFAIDTCIYHRGRSTFSLLEQTENFDINALLVKNRAYMNKKWNLGITNYRVPIKLPEWRPVKRTSWREKVAATSSFKH